MTPIGGSMIINSYKAKKGKSVMGAARRLEELETPVNGQTMIDQLRQRLDVSETMLAALLDTTSRSFNNWKNLSKEELGTKTKSKRLCRLYEFMNIALDEGVAENELLSFINEPLDLKDENSESVLYHIVENTLESAFKTFSILAIRNFQNT